MSITADKYIILAPSKSIASSRALVLLLVVIVALLLQQLSYTSAATTNTQFIRTSCSSTTYPKLCYNTLSAHASAIQQSPKLLAHTALSLSLNTARATSADMARLSRGTRMAPREASAMRDCVEELSDSVDRLRSSMAEMDHIDRSNFEAMMSDVQTWVSAALTDEDTCTDGFAGNEMNGAVKEVVRGKIVNVAHMTSNALALINSYGEALHY